MQFVAAMFASFLPARHWSRFESLPVDRAAPIAAVVTLIVAGFLGVAGFIRYTDTIARDTGRLTLEIAERQVRGELPESAVVSGGPMAAAMLAPLAFLFLTPAGQLSGYFVFTSLVRAVTWVGGEPMGDPLLTLLDKAMVRVSGRARVAHERHARERLEGAEVPDRLYPGSWARLTGVDFVVVSSRRKPDWAKGTTVVAGEEWFSLGEPFELHTADGLRTVYPLTRQREGEVVRHRITYTLPPLRTRPATKPTPGSGQV